MDTETYGLFAGDVFYYTATAILIGRLVKTQSCVGFSGKMQIIYTMVHTTQGLRIICSSDDITTYFTIKTIIMICNAYLILYLIYRKYRLGYEKEFDKFWIESNIILALILALFESTDLSNPSAVISAFAGYLEALVVVPQIYFTYRSEKHIKFVSYYIAALTCYSLFYIIHWTDIYSRNGNWNPYTVYAALVNFTTSIIYFIFTCAMKRAEKQVEVLPYTPRPEFVKQQSLLETPFLKRSLPSSNSIFTISGNSSVNTTPNGSISDFKMDGKY